MKISFIERILHAISYEFSETEGKKFAKKFGENQEPFWGNKSEHQYLDNLEKLLNEEFEPFVKVDDYQYIGYACLGEGYMVIEVSRRLNKDDLSQLKSLAKKALTLTF